MVIQTVGFALHFFLFSFFFLIRLTLYKPAEPIQAINIRRKEQKRQGKQI